MSPHVYISTLFISSQIKSNAAGVKKAIESGLADDIPTKFLKDADINDLPDITGDSTEVTIDVDAKRVCKLGIYLHIRI